MKILDYILLGLLALWAMGAVYAGARQKKRGCCDCGGCTACGSCDSCRHHSK